MTRRNTIHLICFIIHILHLSYEASHWITSSILSQHIAALIFGTNNWLIGPTSDSLFRCYKLRRTHASLAIVLSLTDSSNLTFPKMMIIHGNYIDAIPLNTCNPWCINGDIYIYMLTAPVTAPNSQRGWTRTQIPTLLLNGTWVRLVWKRLLTAISTSVNGAEHISLNHCHGYDQEPLHLLATSWWLVSSA